MAHNTLPLIKTLLAEVCDIDASTIKDQGQLTGYGLDSVRTLDLLVALEERHGITVDEQDPALAKVRSVKDLADFVAERQRR